MSFLLDCTIRVCILLAVALFAMGLLRKRSAATRHWVLSAALLCSLATPILMRLMPAWNPERAIVTAFLPTSADSLTVETTVTAHKTAAIVATSPAPPIVFRKFLKFAWAAGFAFGIGMLVIGAVRLKWMASVSRPVLDGPWKGLTDEIAHVYGLSRPVTVLQSRRPSLLVTWGVLRPRVILPAGAGDWPEERIRVVLCHELAHIQRRDWFVQIAAELLRTFYWFNPLLWIVCNRLRRESEHACDDAVLNLGIVGSDYAAHLLDLARVLNKFDRAWSPALAMARPSTLERRFAAMLNPDLNRTAITRSSFVLIVIAFLAVTFPVAAFRASAQFASSRFSGTVYDPSGAIVPYTTAVMTNAQAGTRDVTSGDETGVFTFSGLPAGNYVLETSVPGFKTTPINVTLHPSDDLHQDVRLNVASVMEEVTVMGRGTPASTTAPSSLNTGGIPRRIRQGGNVQMPRLVAPTKPVYPDSARLAGIQGTITMEGVIGTNGNILELRVLNALADPDLAKAALDSVKQWQYNPTLLNGVPVEVVATIVVNFALQQ